MPWWNNKPWKICFCNPFWPSVTFHIETSNLICIAYQMAGFYLRFKTGVKWFKQGVGSLRSTCDVVCCFLKFLRLQVYFLRDILQIMNWKVFGGISFWKTSRWLPLRFERLQDLLDKQVNSYIPHGQKKCCLLRFTRFKDVWRNFLLIFTEAA